MLYFTSYSPQTTVTTVTPHLKSTNVIFESFFQVIIILSWAWIIVHGSKPPPSPPNHTLYLLPFADLQYFFFPNKRQNQPFIPLDQ